MASSPEVKDNVDSEPRIFDDPFSNDKKETVDSHLGNDSDANSSSEIGRNEQATPATLEKHGSDSNQETPAVLENVKAAAHSAKGKFHLENIRATGPSKAFNPTSIRMHVRFNEGDSDRSDRPRNMGEGPSARADANKEMALLWRSRDNRKGRNSIVVPNSASTEPLQPPRYRPRLTAGLKSFGKNILLMGTTFPYWDMAFWSGWSYSMGSILFVIDGAFGWGPLAFPSTEFAGETKYGVPLCFFFGAIFYQIGATMAYFEAVNDGSFQGSAMRRFLEGHEEDEKKMLDEKIHAFFGHFVPHPGKKREQEQAETIANAVDPEAGWKTKDTRARPGSIYPRTKAPATRRGGVDLGETEEGESSEYLTWRWWPTWHSLRTHHVYEIGYLACAVQLFGATLYGMTGIVVLPGILDSLSQWQENAAYWIPQMVASTCFLTASFLFTLESQEKWYKPEPKVLGWWIGFWAGVGSTGFLLCAVLGPASGNTGAIYQSSLSSMWGSAAYLISSLLQWYEGVNKNPIEELFNEPGEMKSSQIHPI